MKSIKLRMVFLLILALVSFGICNYQALQSFKKVSHNIEQLDLSYSLLNKLKALPKKNFETLKMKELQAIRKKLTNERSLLLSDALQAYSSYKGRTLKKLIKKINIEEATAQNQFKKNITLNQQLIYKYLITGFFLTGFFILLTYAYVLSSIFIPLRTISQKMIDFLNEKYTYTFTVPAPNEIGNLQTTFNSFAQQVLHNMNELKALDQAKSDFLSIASHELRTPLTSIKGSLSLLRSGISGVQNETGNNLLQIAETETDRLIRIINDVLDLAKIESKHLPMEKKWFDFEDLINQTFESLRGLAATAQVGLKMESTLNKPIVNGDKDRIQQVLTNLLSNAIKYSPQNNDVTVTLKLDNNKYLLIEVTDCGRGIAKQDQERIFQKFRQATGPQNPLVKGTGLGLAIAKALVEEHGGNIDVRSTVGEGSTFYFSLPQWKPHNKVSTILDGQDIKLEEAS